MIFEHTSKNKIFLVFVSSLILLAGIAILAKKNFSAPPAPIACTNEAKICPDGTAVGRIGPDCAFEACPPQALPDNNIIDSWETKTDGLNHATFKYPENIGTAYINTVDWPPQLQIIDEPFLCTEGGNENARAGITEKKIIGSREYCVTKISEGAAGSIYTQYAYAFLKNNKTAILNFSLRFPQCGNYPDEQKNACETERAVFSIDNIINNIALTLQDID